MIAPPRHARRLLPIPLAAVLACLPLSCSSSSDQSLAGDSTVSAPSDAVAFTPDEVAVILSLSPLPPVPPDPTNRVADDPAAAHLGQYLFYETRLSGNGQVSCASCHAPMNSWSDGQRIPAQFGRDLRHVPSLWNVAYNRWFFWDGRADTLWSQALEPLEQPTEHGATRLQCAHVIRDDPSLRRAYERIFGPYPDSMEAEPGQPAPVDQVFVNIGKSLAAYQRRIVSRKAPFDTFVEGLRAGDATRMRAISPAAQRGLQLFIGAANCRSCHHGPNFTDNEFHITGVAALEEQTARDLGRLDGINRLLTSPFSVMGAFNDDPDGRRQQPTAYLVNMVEFRGQFKTPSLRNAAMTAPYMHRGQLRTLEDVVRFYSTLPVPPSAFTPGDIPGSPGRVSSHRHKTGPSGPERVLVPLNLSDGQIHDLVAFLESLTDVRIDSSLQSKPDSPEYSPPSSR